MNEINVKTVKKIKKVVSEPNFIGVDLSKNVADNFNTKVNICKAEFVGMGTLKENYTTNPIAVKKVKKVVKSVEPTYYVHTCGYDYVVDTIDADVAFSGTKDECDDWMKEHSIVEGLEDNANSNEYMNEVECDDSSCDFTDFESGEVEEKNTVDLPTVKKVKKCVVEKVDESEIISFTRVTDLDSNKYKDFFTKERFPRGAIFFDWEVLPYFWCVTFYDVMNYKKTVIVNDRKSLLKFYAKTKDELYFGYNNRNYDNFIYKGILLGMNPKEINDKIVYEGLKGFQITDKFKDIQLYAFDCYVLNHSLKQFESFLRRKIFESTIPFDYDKPLNMEQIEEILDYNDYDVDSTVIVFMKNPYTYDAHMGLIEMFDYLSFNEINKTSAQIVADILKCKKGTHDDSDQWNIVCPPNLQVKKYKHVIDWFLNPQNHDLSKKADFEIMGLKHTIGWGGIHASVAKEYIDNKDGGIIMHLDVNSYYPSLGIFAKVYPEDKTIFELAFGKEGHKIYKEIYEKRLQLKREGKKKEQAPLKIVLNGTYGILRDKNSNAYYPRGATLISVYGQMYLVDLIEHLEEAKCCRILNSNTDGLLVKCFSEKDIETVEKIRQDWERRSLMGLARDDINYAYFKDVNNYLFEFANGKIEVKGSYVKETNDLDNDLPIVNECIREYIMHKVNVEEFINNCDELWRFMKTFKLSGNYKEVYHNGIKYTNKCYRVFASKNLKDTYLGKKKADSDTIEKFAGQSDHVFIENGDIHGKKCSEYPLLDKQWYINLVYDRLEDFGIDARPDIFSDMF